MRKLFAILTMLAALMLASVTAFAAPSLVDNAKLLTPQRSSVRKFWQSCTSRSRRIMCVLLL